jgi:hypothetical protein
MTREIKSVAVTLHSQSGDGYDYYIYTPLNTCTCWRRGDRHSVHLYVRALEKKLNARWNEGFRTRSAGDPKRLTSLKEA